MNQPTRAAIIFRALQLLRGGTLANALPNELMSEFGLSAEYAYDVGLAAMKRWRAEKPLCSESNGEKQKAGRIRRREQASDDKKRWQDKSPGRWQGAGSNGNHRRQ
jgi:hypothetical protein